MVSKGTIAHAAFGVGMIAIILILLIKFFWKEKPKNEFQLGKNNSLEKGIASLHAQAAATAVVVADSARRRPSLHGFRRNGGWNKTLFNWADNPSLVTDAVETGWVRFAFTLSPSVKPTSLLGMCAAGESASSALETELSWEMGQASSDFLQRIRLNPGMRISSIRSSLGNSSSNSNFLSAIRTALPLPGPACAFPQDAYFEIIVLSCREEDEEESLKIREGEKLKLIRENGSNDHRLSDSNIIPTGARDDGRSSNCGRGGLFLSVGLTVGGLLPMKLPGSFPGSIGFVSNGSLHHDGNKLVSELDKGDWGYLTGKVIGCGFVPSQKVVFFTVDAELVHTITCTTEEFGSPLYPTVAANCDITILVNNGQSPFKYLPANANRRPNPCFIASPVQSGTLDEDSKELFSMGRIDSDWHDRSGPRSSVYMGNGTPRVKDYDEVSDVDDMFEIILEGDTTSSSLGR